MSTVTAPELIPPSSERGAAIMVSYKELVEIRTAMNSMTAMLQAALALQGDMKTLDKRMTAVELTLAGKAGERRTWNTILGVLLGWLTAAIGGGALMILPKLWGG